MSGDRSASGSVGIGFTGGLTLLFIGLKLTGFVDWPWWVVLSPLGIPALLAVVVLVVVVVVAVVKAVRS